MKQLFFILLVIMATANAAIAQVPITYYDFEKDSARSTGEATVEQQVNTGSTPVKKKGSLTLSYNEGAAQFNGGTEAGKCISVSGWPAGAMNSGAGAATYLQFTTSVAGFSTIKLALQAKVSDGSPIFLGVLYSLDGTTFFPAATAPIALRNSWQTLTYFDLPAGADNAASLTFRLYAFGGSDGNTRLDIDNLLVTANAQVAGIKTLLDDGAFGTSFLSGKAFNYPWTNFTVNNVGTICRLQTDMNIAGTFTVNAGAALDCGANTLGGRTYDGRVAGNFIVNKGGYLRIGSAAGITAAGIASGNIQTSTRSFSAEAAYEFAGTVNQVIGNGLPAYLTGSLIITNNKIVTLSEARTIGNGGTVSLGEGELATGSNLTLESGSTIIRSEGILTGKPAGNAILVYTGNSKTASAEWTSALEKITVNLLPGKTLTVTEDSKLTDKLVLESGVIDFGPTKQSISGSIERNGVSQTGTLKAGKTTLVFNGNAEQSIPAESIVGSIKNLVIKNPFGLTINSSQTISEALVLGAGLFSLNGQSLKLTGTVTGTGSFKGSPSSELIISSLADVGAINFDQTAEGQSNALGNLSVTAGNVALGTKLNLYHSLIVSGGTLDLAAKNLVLKSLPSGTAGLAPVTGTITNATNVTVEHFLPNRGRRYQFISSGVNTVSSIKTNWMEGGMNTEFCATCNIVPAQGYGMQISGPGGNINGFDATATNNASLFAYNQFSGNWTPVTSTAGPLNATTPYLAFVRGDRAVDMTAIGSDPATLPSAATTLRATGTLPIGAITINSLAGNGKTNLIANPYPSSISWAKLYADNSTSIESYCTSFDPAVGHRGAYVTVTSSGLRSNPAASANEQISSGQGFMVTSKPGIATPSLLIREEDKILPGETAPQSSALSNGLEKFYIALNFKTEGGEKFSADAVLEAFGSQFSNNIDGNDAAQIANFDEDIAILREGKNLSIETRNMLTENDTIRLSMARLKAQSYEWQFTPDQMARHPFTGYLVDNYLKSETPVRLSDTTTISFTVTGDPASAAADRFLVIFKKAPAIVPARFTSVMAYEQENGYVRVDWKVGDETDIATYEVEKSANPHTFSRMQVVLSSEKKAADYAVLDNAAQKGKTYYRIKAIDKNGLVTYSNVVELTIAEAKQHIAVYPTPFSSADITVQLTNMPKGAYNIFLWNSAGALLKNEVFEHNGGAATKPLQMPPQLAAGTYQLQVKGPGYEKTFSLVKE